MVSDNPESFADLDGHQCTIGPGGSTDCKPDVPPANAPATTGEGHGTPNTGDGTQQSPSQDVANQAAAQNAANKQQLSVSPQKGADVKYGNTAREQSVDYNLVQMDSKGKASPAENPDHKIELREKLVSGNPAKVKICTGQCVAKGTLTDTMTVTAGKGHSVEKRFLIDGNAAKIYDPGTKKAYDFVRVDASVKRGFVFNYGNDRD